MAIHQYVCRPDLLTPTASPSLSSFAASPAVRRARRRSEVRNLLTSLELDLQGLQRQVRNGSLPAAAEAPLSSSLREVNRLDTVVRGVVQLAHQSGAGHRRLLLRAEHVMPSATLVVGALVSSKHR